MKNLQAVDEVVDLSHETLHENHLRQADAHVLQLGGEGLHLREIVQLHSGGEVEKHVSQIRTLVRQFVENGVGDQFDRELDVPQRCTETRAVAYQLLFPRLCYRH